MGKNIFYFERFLVVISSASARIYLFKVNNGITRIRCENCSGLKMKTLEQCQWCHSSVFIANCEHVSNFFLIVDFEELGSYWKNKHHWRQDRVYALFCCILSVNKIPLLTKYLNLYHYKSTCELMRNFTSDVDSGWKDTVHIQNDLLHIFLFTDFCSLVDKLD